MCGRTSCCSLCSSLCCFSFSTRPSTTIDSRFTSSELVDPTRFLPRGSQFALSALRNATQAMELVRNTNTTHKRTVATKDDQLQLIHIATSRHSSARNSFFQLCFPCRFHDSIFVSFSVFISAYFSQSRELPILRPFICLAENNRKCGMHWKQAEYHLRRPKFRWIESTW